MLYSTTHYPMKFYIKTWNLFKLWHFPSDLTQAHHQNFQNSMEFHWYNKIWWLCLVPTSTTRFASDVGYRMAKKLIGLYKEIILLNNQGSKFHLSDRLRWVKMTVGQVEYLQDLSDRRLRISDFDVALLYILQTSEWYIRTSDFYNPLARRTSAFNSKFQTLTMTSNSLT